MDSIIFPQHSFGLIPKIFNTPRSYASMKRYQEIIEFSYKVINKKDNWANYRDNRWNTTAPKMVDNAIIMIRDAQKEK